MIKNYFIASFVVLSVIALGTFPVQSVNAKPIALQPVDLVPVGESRLSGGLHIENDRSLAETPAGNEIEYDNTRFKAFDLRMGILDNMEINMGVNYSDNSANSTAAPDNGGIEGIRLGTKLKFHPNVSAQLTGKFNGSEDVHPYGSDNPALRANIPIKFRLGDGMFHAEGGLTLQSGDAIDGAGNTIDWKSYGNYGIGYSYGANHFTDVSMEVIGHTATVEDDNSNLDFNDALKFLLGMDIRLARGVHVKPSTGFALMEGSPNFSFGLDYEIAFEGQHFRRTEREETVERYSKRKPVGAKEPRTQKKESAERMPSKDREEETERKKQQATDQATKKEKVNALMERGYQAAENGNLNKALNHYKAAEDLDPNSLLVQSNLGSLHYRMGNYKKARDHYRKAINANPNDTFSLLYLGASHYQLGNTQRAREYFERVQRLEPDNKRVEQWLEKMD